MYSWRPEGSRKYSEEGNDSLPQETDSPRTCIWRKEREVIQWTVVCLLFYSTTRYLIQLLEYCENLEHLKIYAKDVVWVTSEQFPVRPVKLSKLKFFVIQLEYTKRNELLENVARPIGAFIHKMLNQNRQKLKGWCEVPGRGIWNRKNGVLRNCMRCKDLIIKMLHDFGIADEEQD